MSLLVGIHPGAWLTQGRSLFLKPAVYRPISFGALVFRDLGLERKLTVVDPGLYIGLRLPYPRGGSRVTGGHSESAQTLRR
jgi:hypothetical protein